MNIKRQKTESLMKCLASDFIQSESSGASLITVTSVRVRENLRSVKILVSVFPEEKEEEAIAFLKRKRGAMREYVKRKSRLRFIPHIDFAIDGGEKNRQALESLV